jgi:hypothetical protein
MIGILLIPIPISDKGNLIPVRVPFAFAFAFAKRLEEKRLPAQRGYANEIVILDYAT